MTIDFEKMGGLVPAIVQDATTKTVLMLGYMNKEAFDKTVETKRVTFYSRSRQCLWTKGETSGNFLNLVDIKVGVGFAYGLYARMYVVVACGKVAQVAQHQVARAGHRVNEVRSADDIIIGFAQIHVEGSVFCAVDIIRVVGQCRGGIVGEITLACRIRVYIIQPFGSHLLIICPAT